MRIHSFASWTRAPFTAETSRLSGESAWPYCHGAIIYRRRGGKCPAYDSTSSAIFAAGSVMFSASKSLESTGKRTSTTRDPDVVYTHD